MKTKLVKFETLKEELDLLADAYKEAKEEENEEKLEQLKEEYLNLRTKLYSHKMYYKGLKDLNVEIMTEEAKEDADLSKLKQLKLKKFQKKLFKKNNSYVNMVVKSDDVEEFVKQNDNKPKQFVKRHFKKAIVVGGLAAVLLVSLRGCSNSKDKKDDKTTTQITTESTTEAIEEKTKEKVTTEEAKADKKQEKEDKKQTKQDKFIKLNPIVTFDDENSEVIITYDKDGNEVKIERFYAENNFQKDDIVKEEAQNPHIENVSEENTNTTSTYIVTETEVKEKEPVDYNFGNDKKGYEIPKEEKVTITETKEEKEVETYKGDKVDGEKNKKPTGQGSDKPEGYKIPEKEIVTIIDKGDEDVQETYQGDVIDEVTTVEYNFDNSSKGYEISEEEKVTIIETKEEKPTQVNMSEEPKTEEKTINRAEENKEEKVTYYENYENTQINDSMDMPIEEDEPAIGLVYRR